MKILLDECMPVRLRHLITGHDVYTVEYMRWKGMSNGELLILAATEHFDVLLTVDRGQLRQLPAQLPLAVLVIRAKHNSLQVLRPLVPKILGAISAIAPRSLQFLDEEP